MNFRFVAVLCLILAAAAVLPVSAQEPGPVTLPVPDEGKTGSVWVTIANISGSTAPGPGLEGPVMITYAVGDVAEINRTDIIEDATTGVVTVTMADHYHQGQYVLASRDASVESPYLINSITVAAKSDPLLTNGQSFSVVPATANFYADTVPSGKQHEWVDLEWKDRNRDLDLTVYAPDTMLGPYSDISDGRKDGRIFLDFSSLMNVTAGTWFFRVQNTNPDYTPYTLNTYSA